ncbi:MAG: nucleotidyl transferase AbiEii/AbiGii toxin family protein [Thermoanaerobaculia bacterium]
MASSQPKLTDFQRRVLEAFFEREKGFFLTGGGALAGFHLQHRTTEDLDFFTAEEAAFERGPHVLADVAAALGASIVVRQQTTGFHRYFVSRGDEAVVVDLVHDRVPQLHIEKENRDGISIDLPEEILANKLTTIASRSEIRDLVDVMMLERAGYSLDEALKGALEKDGGCTPATLAWVLSQVEISAHAKLPGGVSGAEMSEYVEDLVRRFRRAAAPAG